MYRSLNNKGIEFPPDDTVSVFSPIMTEKAKAVSDFSLKGKICMIPKFVVLKE